MRIVDCYIVIENFFSENLFFIFEVIHFLYFLLLLFPQGSHSWIVRRIWLKISPKVYDAMLCLNRNLNIQIVQYLESKEGLILKLGQLIKYYIEKIKFSWKIGWKCVAETSSRPLFNFWEIAQNVANSLEKLFNKYDILKEYYQKSSKNLAPFLFFSPVSFHGHYYGKQNGHGIS